MRGFIHETVPIGPFEVSLELPAGARARRVRCLRRIKWRRSGAKVTGLIVDVPRRLIHEVIAVDLV